jgi:Right handed beta helix region
MKKASKIIIPLAALILLVALVIPATTIHQVEAITYPDDVWVAPPPIGIDTIDRGTETAPFATIGYGIEHVDSSGTVHVAAGTYHENLHIGNAQNLSGAGAHNTFIDGGGSGHVIDISSGPFYNTISGFTLQNGSTLTASLWNSADEHVLYSGIKLPSIKILPQLFDAEGMGGGIYISGQHIVTLEDCTIKGNQSGTGGGIYNDGELQMFGCTVSGNSASYDGGGIYNRGYICLTNCTISGNSAFDEGGGIYNFPSSEMNSLYSTIANNHATGVGSRGGGFSNWGQATFESTIVADNTAGDGIHNNGFTEPAQGGVTTSNGYNIDSEDSCNFDAVTDLINTDPLLGPLQDNGGPSFTHALLHGSPAIDHGIGEGFPSTDQRGVPRWQGSTCDTGAYELAQASVDTSTNEGTASFSTLDGYITDLKALSAGQAECGPLPNFDFPFGLFSFNVTDITPGSTVTVIIILPSNAPPNTQYWKCLNGHWVDCTSLLGSNDGDQVLTLTITDGGLGDGDGLANGQISDPGGPVMAAPTSAHPSVSPSLPRLLNPPTMSVQFVSVNPQQAVANQPVTISTNVVNTGDQGGNLNVTLKINGQVEATRMVSVGPQASQPIKFTVARAQPGTYSIDIGGQTGSFTIPDSHGNKGAPANTGIIIFLVLAVLAIAVVTVLLLNRHPA